MLGVGSLVLFAGRRWRVEAVDDRAKTLDVVPHRAGQVPKFDAGSGEPINDRLARCMHEVLKDQDEPPYLDPQAKLFLAQARTAYRELRLDQHNAFAVGRDAYLMTWCGTSVNGLLAVLVRAAGLDCEVEDVGIVAAGTTPVELLSTLAKVAEFPPLHDLSGFVENVRGAKLDAFIGEGLLRRLWCQRHEEVRPRVTHLLHLLRQAGAASSAPGAGTADANR
jgi:ATP-dependent Lhr-like helicase